MKLFTQLKSVRSNEFRVIDSKADVGLGRIAKVVNILKLRLLWWRQGIDVAIRRTGWENQQLTKVDSQYMVSPRQR